MSSEGSRKVAQAIHQKLAMLIRTELRDPVFESVMTTVTHVDVNRDGSFANVYVSFFGGQDADDKRALRALKKAGAFLRGPLARQCGLRRAPELRFFYDQSEDMRRTLQELKNERSDAEIDAVAVADSDAVSPTDAVSDSHPDRHADKHADITPKRDLLGGND